MATITAQISDKSVGEVNMQQGNTTDGTPDHAAPDGTIFVDPAYNRIWHRSNSVWALSPTVCFGAIYTRDQTSNVSVSAGAWTTFEGIYTWTASELLNVAQTSNGRLYIGSGYDGTYITVMTATVDYLSTTGQNLDFGISINGASPRSQDYYSIYGHQTWFSPSVFCVVSELGLTGGDYVTMSVRAAAASTVIRMINTDLVLIKLD